jgi:hypothetical protein
MGRADGFHGSIWVLPQQGEGMEPNAEPCGTAGHCPRPDAIPELRAFGTL